MTRSVVPNKMEDVRKRGRVVCGGVAFGTTPFSCSLAFSSEVALINKSDNANGAMLCRVLRSLQLASRCETVGLFGCGSSGLSRSVRRYESDFVIVSGTSYLVGSSIEEFVGFRLSGRCVLFLQGYSKLGMSSGDFGILGFSGGEVALRRRL